MEADKPMYVKPSISLRGRLAESFRAVSVVVKLMMVLLVLSRTVGAKPICKTNG